MQIKGRLNITGPLKARLNALKANRDERIILYVGLAAILCLSSILFVHNLGSISLWDPDEPRQAIEAREMMERSDYVHPYLNGEPYLEKPPLYPWLIILASKIHGELDEFSDTNPAVIVKDQYGLPEEAASRFLPVATVTYEKDRYVIFSGGKKSNHDT